MKCICWRHRQRLPGVIVIDCWTDVTMIYNLISRLDGAERKSSDMITVLPGSPSLSSASISQLAMFSFIAAKRQTRLFFYFIFISDVHHYDVPIVHYNKDNNGTKNRDHSLVFRKKRSVFACIYFMWSLSFYIVRDLLRTPTLHANVGNELFGLIYPDSAPHSVFSCKLIFSIESHITMEQMISSLLCWAV